MNKHKTKQNRYELTFGITYLIHTAWVGTCQSAGLQKCASTLNAHRAQVLV